MRELMERLCSSFATDQHFIILLSVVIFFNLMFIRPSSAQCADTSGCYPVSVELLGTSDTRSFVNVSSTCGENGVSNYSKILKIFTDNYEGSSDDNKIFQCDGSATYSKQNIVDKNTKIITVPFEYTDIRPVLTTYWQSENAVPEQIVSDPTPQYIIMNLTDPFLVEWFIVSFINPKFTPDILSDPRPRQLVIEKMGDDSQWQVMRYYATDCGDFPNLEVKPIYDASPTKVYCQKLTPPNMYLGGNIQQVILDPKEGGNQQLVVNKAVQDYYITSAFQMRLLQPADRQDSLRSYYAVADISIHGMCACYGHADSCSGENNEKCVCEHNTEGDHCERCKPLYNNRPWQMGTPTVANQCKECNCNGYADSCHYDLTMLQGVCDNCHENTTGVACDDCETSFFRNSAVQNSTADANSTAASCSGNAGTSLIVYRCNRWCIPCDCNLNGTKSDSGYICDPVLGQCQCKLFVTGRVCDTCQNTYWGLSVSNPYGCAACNCEVAGTINTTNYCDKVTGACVCKFNTQNPTCSECKPNTYTLDRNNPAGCTACDCDPGASSVLQCETGLGMCRCRSSIEGRDCRRPKPGYFVPKLDYLTFEAELTNLDLTKFVERVGHGDPDGTLTGRGFLSVTGEDIVIFTVNVPSTTGYDVIIRYESDADVTFNAEIALASGGSYICKEQNYEISSLKSLAPASLSKGAVSVGKICLATGSPYTVTVTAQGATAATNTRLDSIVLLPILDDITAFTLMNADTQARIMSCTNLRMSVNNKKSQTSDCPALEYSIMAELYGGAVSCQCNVPGTEAGTFCDPRGGQCHCEPGVMLRTCQMCRVDQYGVNLQDGCQACDCNPGGSVRMSCNETSACECLTNVIGIKCDACLPEYYGLSTGTGCSPCRCEMQFSYNNSCADTGQCYCKPGVGGLNCDRCSDGFYNLTVEGCADCQCHPDGSTQHSCNNQTGACECKTKTIGNQCSDCVSGYYGVGQWADDGCLACYCSGHRENCSSSDRWYRYLTVSEWSLQAVDAVSERWTGINDIGSEIMVNDPVIIHQDLNTAQFVMRIINSDDVVNHMHLYFVAPKKFLGDKRSAYGQTLSLVMSMNTQEGLFTDRDDGDVSLQGTYNNFQLVTAFPSTPAAGKTTYTLPIRQGLWFKNSVTGDQASYEEIIQTLANLEALKIRGKFSNVTDSEVDLYTVTLVHASRTNDSGQTVNNVEVCGCRTGYEGDYCEFCADGYTREVVGSGPTGSCIPCTCNHHDGGPCDSHTGICNCIHNTVGDKCESCQTGFYGDATQGNPDDCGACMCPGNVVTGSINVFALTCVLDSTRDFQCQNCSEGHQGQRCESCVSGYYGEPTMPSADNNQGRCIPCECNGRADMCNSTTGICVDCRNETSGKECDICAPGYYGNAMNYNCKFCSCNESIGSTGDCDPMDGRCVCLPNVQGFLCDACIPNAFNHSSGIGCTMCDCDPDGATDVRCELEFGQCPCKTYVTGRKCDMCDDTYWKLTNTGCISCGCTETGTKNVTSETFGKCDLETGQCTCELPGIIGPTCDHCAPVTTEIFIYISTFYIGEYPNCTLCGKCYDDWAIIIDGIGTELDTLNSRIYSTWSYYGNTKRDTVEGQITDIQDRLKSANQSVNIVANITDALSDLQDQLNQLLEETGNATSDLNSWKEQLTDLETKLNEYKELEGQVELDIGTSVDVEDLLQSVENVRDEIIKQFDAGSAIWANITEVSQLFTSSDKLVNDLETRVQSALQLLSSAKQSSDTAMTIYKTFQHDHTNNQNSLSREEASLQTAQTNLDRAMTLIDAVQTAIADVDQSVAPARQGSDEALQKITGILSDLVVIKENATQAHYASTVARDIIASFKTLASNTKSNMSTSLVSVAEGLQWLVTIEQQLTETDSLVTAILALDVRPVEDMDSITQQISNTAISSDTVQETNERAETAIETAQNALDVTKTATDEAHLALEEVTSIQRNLKDSADLRNQTSMMVEELQALNNTIFTVVTDLEGKSTDYLELATTTGQRVAEILGSVETVQQCLQTTQEQIASAQRSAQTAENLLQPLSQKNLENSVLVGNISQILGEKTGGTNLQQLQTLLSDLYRLTNDIEHVKTITDLTYLLEMYVQTKADMEQVSDMAELKRQVDATIKLLESTTETPVCNNV